MSFVTVFRPDVISPPLFSSANIFPAGAPADFATAVAALIAIDVAVVGFAEAPEVSTLNSLISNPYVIL
jgi:hypothetical protein